MREERLIVKPFEDFRLLEYHAFQEMNHHARAELTGSIPYVKKEEYIKAVRHKLWVQVIALSEGVESLIFYGLIEKKIRKIQENIGFHFLQCILQRMVRGGIVCLRLEIGFGYIFLPVRRVRLM